LSPDSRKKPEAKNLVTLSLKTKNYVKFSDGNFSKIVAVMCLNKQYSAKCFLSARLGYTDLTIFEKEDYYGGLNTSELPAYR
jgi:hypothetical protein